MNKKLWQRAYRRKNGYVAEYRYRRTLRGVLAYAYSRMLRRVKNTPSYNGLPVCTRAEFYAAFLDHPDYLRLYAAYSTARTRGLKKRRHWLLPTPDRVNSSKGYTVDNIAWVTYIDNVRRPGPRRPRDMETFRRSVTTVT